MTEDFTANIALYHNLFLVCMALFLASSMIAVLLFFLLDIRDVIAYLTGRKARKQIQQLEHDAIQNGHLQITEHKKNNQKFLEKISRRTKEKIDKKGQVDGLQQTEKLGQTVSGNDSTEQLDRNEMNPPGQFEIVQEIILIHTEEQI